LDFVAAGKDPTAGIDVAARGEMQAQLEALNAFIGRDVQASFGQAASGATAAATALRAISSAKPASATAPAPAIKAASVQAPAPDIKAASVQAPAPDIKAASIVVPPPAESPKASEDNSAGLSVISGLLQQIAASTSSTVAVLEGIASLGIKPALEAALSGVGGITRESAIPSAAQAAPAAMAGPVVGGAFAGGAAAPMAAAVPAAAASAEAGTQITAGFLRLGEHMTRLRSTMAAAMAANNQLTAGSNVLLSRIAYSMEQSGAYFK
jgi:hypothetical protein